MCTVGGGTERGVEKLCVCLCVGGGVGQTARNRGNRGHGVSAEIKKKRERKPPRKQPRDDGERVWVCLPAWLGEREEGCGSCCLVCFGSHTKHLCLSASAGLRLWL